MEEKKKIFKVPDTILLIFGLTMIMASLTWILPSGEYDRVLKEGKNVVIPGSYHAVDPNPTSFIELFQAPVRGIVEASDVIAFVLIVGGVFCVLSRTGALNAGIQSLMNATQGKMYVFLFAIMFILAISGTTTGEWEGAIPFFILIIPVALKLGIDPLAGVAMILLGCGTGNIASTINPFATGIASSFAEISVKEGMGFRIFLLLTSFPISYIYVTRYAYAVKRDLKKNSLVANRFHIYNEVFETQKEEFPDMSGKHKIILIMLGLGIGFMFYGVVNLNWYITELAALYLFICFTAAILARMSQEEFIDAFMQGAKNVIYAAIMIGFARGIIVVARDGRIIDTILYNIASLLEGKSNFVFMHGMFFVQQIIAVLVPSSSAHAAVTTSIMCNLADLINFPRELVVTVYQVGNGLTNFMTPTDGVLIGSISIARVPYPIWLRFIIPFVLMLGLWLHISLAAYYFLFF